MSVILKEDITFSRSSLTGRTSWPVRDAGSAVWFSVWKQEGVALPVGHQSLHGGHLTQTWHGQGVSEDRGRDSWPSWAPLRTSKMTLLPLICEHVFKENWSFSHVHFPPVLELRAHRGTCSPSSPKVVVSSSSFFLHHSWDPLVYPESQHQNTVAGSAEKMSGLLWPRITTSTSNFLPPEKWQRRFFFRSR